MSSLQADLELGEKGEKEIQHILNLKYGLTVKKTAYIYSKYDFENEKYIFELKTRRNKKNQYPTTLIGYDKLPDEKETRKLIFLFNFIDGLYFIEYDKDKFNNYEVKNFKRNYRTGYDDKEKEYLYIPIKDLIKFE